VYSEGWNRRGRGLFQFACGAAFPKLVGRKMFLKCNFFNYIKIKNHKKWESEITNKIIWIFGNGRNENQISK
jgi:hypothetical protein